MLHGVRNGHHGGWEGGPPILPLLRLRQRGHHAHPALVRMVSGWSRLWSWGFVKGVVTGCGQSCGHGFFVKGVVTG